MVRQIHHVPLRLFFVTAVSCWGAVAAVAQTNSLFGNRGPASQIGTNLTGTAVGQGSTFGSALGNSLGGQGISGQPAGGLFGGSFIGGQQTADGTTGFVGRDDSAGRFVGDQRVRQPGGNRNITPRQFGNRAGNAGDRARGRFGNNGPDQGETGRRRTLRPRQEVAFSFIPRQPAVVSQQFNTRLVEISQRQIGLQGVTVEVNATGTAVLRGTVDTSETKRLAAILARLEPGVRTVANELTIRE